MKKAGIVKTKVADGRYEIGWEVSQLTAADFNAIATPIIGIQINNDADFLIQRMHVYEFGAAGAQAILSPLYTMQVKDSSTGNVFYLQPGSPYHIAQVPYIPNTTTKGLPLGRFGMNGKGLPAPYLMRRASSAFITFTKASGAPAVTGDVYVVFEGIRIYTGEREPVPATIEGYNTPYSWAGQLVVPGSLAAGVQNLGTITMAGPGLGKYVLKDCTLATSAGPVNVNGYALPSDACLGFQVQDTRTQQKLWARNPSPLTGLAPFMPGFCLTGSGQGLPWLWPRYIEGQDQLAITIFGDPTAFTGGTPGTIDLSFNGVCIYG